MEYLQIYLHRIPGEKTGEFLQVMKDARIVYNRYDVCGEDLFLLDDPAAKYELTGLWEIFQTESDERIWLGINRFSSAAHCHEVMKKVDADPDIDPLYDKMMSIVQSASRILHGDFRHVSY